MESRSIPGNISAYPKGNQPLKKINSWKNTGLAYVEDPV
jgi:hypothetical protein